MSSYKAAPLLIWDKASVYQKKSLSTGNFHFCTKISIQNCLKYSMNAMWNFVFNRLPDNKPFKIFLHCNLLALYSR